jgi:hypothetical protein
MTTSFFSAHQNFVSIAGRASTFATIAGLWCGIILWIAVLVSEGLEHKTFMLQTIANLSRRNRDLTTPHLASPPKEDLQE